MLSKPIRWKLYYIQIEPKHSIQFQLKHPVHSADSSVKLCLRSDGHWAPVLNGRHFADDFFRCILVNEKFCNLIKISLKSVPQGLVDNNQALIHIMTWCRPGDKPLSDPRLTWLADAYMRHQGKIGSTIMYTRVGRSTTRWFLCYWRHYDDVIMTTLASQITSLAIVYSIVYSDADQRKHQSSVSLAFVWGIHRGRWIPRTNGQ